VRSGINYCATLAVFGMTLFIQRANRCDNLALHAKLDELLRVDDDARSELTQLDEQELEVIGPSSGRRSTQDKRLRNRWGGSFNLWFRMPEISASGSNL
jgi:low affinity Fe/Cu permease